MNAPLNKSIDDLWANHKSIEEALSRAAREAILDHARAGNPVASWQDGKVVWLQPAEVLARFAAPSANGGHECNHGLRSES